VFDIERGINGQDTDRRLAVRQDLSAPLVTEMEVWMREQRAKLSRGHDLAWAFDYILKRWAAFTRFLDDGRIAVSPYLPKQQRSRARVARRGHGGASLGCSVVLIAAVSVRRDGCRLKANLCASG
jgi:hypothetical protein